MAEDEEKKTGSKEEVSPSKTDTVEGEKKTVKRMKKVKVQRVRPKDEVEQEEESTTKKSQIKQVKKKEDAGESKTEEKEAVEKKPKKAKKPKVKVEKESEKADEKEEKEPEKEEEEDEEEAEEEAEEEEAEEEEIEIIEEEEKYKVKIKPELGTEVKQKLKVRGVIKKKTPDFKRQEWFRYKRLDESWRRPKGLHSKLRQHKGYRINVVSIGYGSPKATRNLHPSGFEEVMVYNVEDLKKIDPKRQAARVGHSVGTRKRIEIEEKAEEKGIRVLNPRGL